MSETQFFLAALAGALAVPMIGALLSRWRGMSWLRGAEIVAGAWLLLASAGLYWMWRQVEAEAATRGLANIGLPVGFGLLWVVVAVIAPGMGLVAVAALRPRRK
ncbi:MAG: hypothetical protein ACT4OE_06980 [Sphingosinicella sp.]